MLFSSQLLVIAGEFATYLRYVRNMDFFETADYNYLHGLFQSILEKNEWECDWEFDWTIQNGVNYTLWSLPCLLLYKNFQNLAKL